MNFTREQRNEIYQTTGYRNERELAQDANDLEDQLAEAVKFLSEVRRNTYNDPVGTADAQFQYAVIIKDAKRLDAFLSKHEGLIK